MKNSEDTKKTQKNIVARDQFQSHPPSQQQMNPERERKSEKRKNKKKIKNLQLSEKQKEKQKKLEILYLYQLKKTSPGLVRNYLSQLQSMSDRVETKPNLQEYSLLKNI